MSNLAAALASSSIEFKVTDTVPKQRVKCHTSLAPLPWNPFRLILLLVGLAMASSLFSSASLSADWCSMEQTEGLALRPDQPFKSYLTSKVFRGRELWLRCDVGFRMIGCSKVRCIGLSKEVLEKRWECIESSATDATCNSLPRCMPSSALCPALPEFVRGGKWRLASKHQLDQFAPGDTARLTCNRMFKSTTVSSSISCVLDEVTGTLKWDVKELPKCKPTICPPLIPSSLPSGVLMMKLGTRIPFRILSPLSGKSALDDTSFNFACADPPPLPIPYHPGDFRQILFGQNRNEPMMERLTPHYSIMDNWPPYSIECSEQGRWTKKFDLPPMYGTPRHEVQEMMDARRAAAEAEEAAEAKKAQADERFTVAKYFLPDCSSVAYDEDSNDINHSDGLCPPLPFFSDPSIPGWVDGINPSNAMRLNAKVTLDCGKEFWPESSSTNLDHVLTPIAECVKFFRSKSMDDDAEVFDNIGSRSKIIGRWLFRHGSGAPWTGSAPPTCVPRPMCKPLPTYSGWRLASGLPPHKFFANDEAICYKSEVVKGTTTAVTFKPLITTSCVSDGSSTAQYHPSPENHWPCPLVVCSNPGAYPFAFRSAQRHNNFIGTVDTSSIIDEDIRLDYFSVGDVLRYDCFYNRGEFHLLCSPNGNWTMQGQPCLPKS